MHKTMNVLNGLPKTAQPKAKQSLQDIWLYPVSIDMALGHVTDRIAPVPP